MILFKSERSRYLLKAFSSGMVAKVISAIVQLLALPFAANAIGKEQFVAYMVISSFYSWTSICLLGVPAATSLLLAQYLARDQVTKAKRIITSSLSFFVMVEIALILIVVCLSLISTHINVFGLYELDNSKIVLFSLTIGLAGSFSLFLVFVDSIRIGFQTYTTSNYINITSNIVLCVALLGLPSVYFNLIVFVIILNGIPLIGSVLNGCFLLSERRIPIDLRGGTSAALFILIQKSAWLTAVQVGTVIKHNAPIIALAHIGKPAEAAALGALIRGGMLVANVIGVLVQPMLGTATNAVVQREMTWLRKATTFTLALCLAVVFPVCLALTLIGPELVKVWLRGTVEVEQDICTWFAIYLAIWMIQYGLYPTIVALGYVRVFALLMLGEAAVVLLAIFFSAHGSDLIFVAALALATWALSGVVLPLILLRRFYRLSS
jgi:O-antigen/teichoic acid export membrane protein